MLSAISSNTICRITTYTQYYTCMCTIMNRCKGPNGHYTTTILHYIHTVPSVSRVISARVASKLFRSEIVCFNHFFPFENGFVLGIVYLHKLVLKKTKQKHQQSFSIVDKNWSKDIRSNLRKKATVHTHRTVRVQGLANGQLVM